MQLRAKLKVSSYHDQVEQFSPLPAGSSRPRWSVMIPTYNCAGYLRETLQSVLAQDLGPSHMQIEVIDDCSTQDDPEQVVRELGQGRVRFFRQPENVGHTRNFDTCIRRSRGELVHILHGDDRIRPGFYQKMNHLFEQFPHIGAAFCRYIFMFENGHWREISGIEQASSGVLENSLLKIARNQIIQPPSVVVKREVYEQVGGFDHRLKYGEDWEMWVRIAANFPFGYEIEPLAEYRKSNNSITSNFSRQGEDIRYTLLVIKIINEYIEDREKAAVAKYARKSFAWYHRQLAYDFYNRLKDPVGTEAQVKGIFQLTHNPLFLFPLMKLYVKMKLQHR